MSTDLKTTKQITDNIIANLESLLGQSIPFLPKFFLRVIARAFAATYVLLYKYIGYGTLQLFVDTASDQPTTINGRVLTPLNEWGELVGIGDPAEATQAQLNIRVTALVQGGAVTEGTKLIYNPTGVVYSVTTSTLLSDVNVEVPVRAVSDQQGGNGAGVIGNLADGTEITFANPQPDVARTAVVLSTIVPGANGESADVYRQRVKDDFRGRPQGGALADYRRWGEEPAGILNVYPYADETCPGKVLGYVEVVPDSGNPDGIPTNAQLEEVQNSVEYDVQGIATRRPVGALFQALPITRRSFTVYVEGLAAEDVARAQTEITAGVQEYFASREPYIEGLDFPPKRNTVSYLSVGGVVESVATAVGATVQGVELFEGALPIGSVVTLQYGDKAKVDVLFN